MESAVSKQDRIVSSAIDIISESGLQALSTKTLAQKENMPEDMLYKYFSNMDEVLVAVIEQFIKFDAMIKYTVEKMDMSYLDKLHEYIDTYATYYGNYEEISALVLNYESLLHNYNVREKVARTITIKRDLIADLIAGAIREGEISDFYEPMELAMIILGCIQSVLLDRRVTNHETSLREELFTLMSKTLDSVIIK